MSELEPNAWILKPINNAILFVGEETKICGLLMRGLGHIETANPILNLARTALLRKGDKRAVAAIDRLLASSHINEEWAKEIRDNDYSVLHTHSLVSIWAALESAIENLILALILNDTQSLDRLRKFGVKKIDENLKNHDLTEDICLSIYKKLKDVTSVSYDIVQTMQNMLSAFNINVKCEIYKSELLEANAVRNVIVHRFGIVDEKSVKNSPSLAGYVGQPFTISNKKYLTYQSAIGKFLIDVQEKIFYSEYMKWNS
jgi:hypothetical protein